MLGGPETNKGPASSTSPVVGFVTLPPTIGRLYFASQTSYPLYVEEAIVSARTTVPKISHPFDLKRIHLIAYLYIQLEDTLKPLLCLFKSKTRWKKRPQKLGCVKD